MRFEIDIDGGSQFLISVGVARRCSYTSFLNTCKTYVPNSLRDSFFLDIIHATQIAYSFGRLPCFWPTVFLSIVDLEWSKVFTIETIKISLEFKK